MQGMYDRNQRKAKMQEKVAQVLHQGYGDFLILDKDRFDNAFFESIDGGILSKDRKRIYFVGIIDTLTHYGAKKFIEYNAKKIVYGKKISCIPPKLYGERFFNYIGNVVQ